jgi:hypothetical protein
LTRNAAALFEVRLIDLLLRVPAYSALHVKGLMRLSYFLHPAAGDECLTRL